MKKIILKIWKWIGCEPNYNGLILIISLVTLVILYLGYSQVQQVNINLSKLQQLNVEGNSTFGGLATFEQGINASFFGGLGTSTQPTFVQIGDTDLPIHYGCIQIRLRSSNDFVHIIPTRDGDPVIWESGKCQ